MIGESFRSTVDRMRGLFVVACLLAVSSAASAQDGLDEEGLRHDLARTSETCDRMGGGWTMTNPSPMRVFCASRLRSSLVSLVVLRNGTTVISANSGTEDDRFYATWTILDVWGPRMLGPTASNSSLLLDDDGSLITIVIEEQRVIITLCPPGSGPYASLREAARSLGATLP